MLLGTVVSNVWSTRKEESLTGIKFMIVEILETFDDLKSDKNKGRRRVLVAADLIGAGIGDKVLVTKGSSARRTPELKDTPIDAVIVGIIDEEDSKAR